MFKFEKLNDGKILRVSAVNPAEFADYIKNHEDDALTSCSPNSDQCFIEMTESYWVNGWGVFTADEIFQMSECLVIAEEFYTEDDGSKTLCGKVWTNIHNYMIVNPLDAILEDGHYDFILWEKFKTPENFKAV